MALNQVDKFLRDGCSKSDECMSLIDLYRDFLIWANPCVTVYRYIDTHVEISQVQPLRMPEGINGVSFEDFADKASDRYRVSYGDKTDEDRELVIYATVSEQVYASIHGKQRKKIIDDTDE